MNLSFTKNFQFSLKISLSALILAAAMLWASSWQWDRYHEKLELLKEYQNHETAEAMELRPDELSAQDAKKLVHKKVKLKGVYDLDNQLIVINRRHASGSGYWLLAPLKVSGQKKSVIVSRGFIPFLDREKETWKKYDVEGEVEVIAVVQESVAQKTTLSPKNSTTNTDNKSLKLLYPEIPVIAKQLDYPVIESIFLQKLGGSSKGEFPAESITFRVPPSTHFGYTFEWIFLAVATLVIAFLLQAFPRKKRLKPQGVLYKPESQEIQ